jgi:hypothetical protein
MATKEKEKFVSKEEIVDAIERTDWFHINKCGELVHGANSQTDIPLFRYSDICETIDRLFDEKE